MPNVAVFLPLFALLTALVTISTSCSLAIGLGHVPSYPQASSAQDPIAPELFIVYVTRNLSPSCPPDQHVRHLPAGALCLFPGHDNVSLQTHTSAVPVSVEKYFQNPKVQTSSTPSESVVALP